jgi:hypothetical protein
MQKGFPYLLGGVLTNNRQMHFIVFFNSEEFVSRLKDLVEEYENLEEEVERYEKRY